MDKKEFLDGYMMYVENQTRPLLTAMAEPTLVKTAYHDAANKYSNRNLKTILESFNITVEEKDTPNSNFVMFGQDIEFIFTDGTRDTRYNGFIYYAGK